MKIIFGRKINYLPLTICLIVSLIVGYMILLLSSQKITAVILGGVSLLIGLFICSLNLSNYYGYWKIDEAGIHYDNYPNSLRIVLSIIFPFLENQSTIAFNEIKSFAIVVGKNVRAPRGTFGGIFYHPDAVLERLPISYYLSVKLKNNHEIDLNLTNNIDDSEIEKMLIILEKKTGQKPDLIKQQ
ncbi:hypothetical protein LCR01_20100 [Companilactobacillus crustorum]|nr:hypothetical protein [Companilactobacillus crustorum]GEO77567.1 hypothetical protein LCR01_20100 [Companilactobacillus crustorum]